MNPTLREYLLKGVFLGLWAYLAIVQPPGPPDWPRFAAAVAGLAAGVVLALLIQTGVQIYRGVKPWKNPLAFPLIVLVEGSYWVYFAAVAGLAYGIFAAGEAPPGRPPVTYFVLGGLLLGYGFHQLRQVRQWTWRFAAGGVVGAGLIYLALYGLDLLPEFGEVEKRTAGVYLLIGLPFFYLLTFCGETEESEVEIAALSAGLGVGLYLILSGRNPDSVLGDKAIFLAPLGLYFVYVTRVMPGLRVFKHTLRGYSALTTNRPLAAVTAFKRALRLDPANALATEGMWALHQQVDVASLPAGSPLLAHLDYDFCLDRAGVFLLGAKPPTPADRAKAVGMLDLVERQRPQLIARADYLRAVAFAHAKAFDAAAETLAQLLNPETVYDHRVREFVLFPAWDLALRLHPELVKRLGPAELEKPGRRMEAIRAAERQPAGDPAAAELKPILYSGLTEPEFAAAAAGGTPADFNYEYAEQLGLSLADSPETRERGAVFLRIAGRGLPARGPLIFAKLAELATSAEEAHGYREQVKLAGVLAGPKNLPEDQKAVYFDTLKRLAADAEARGDFDAAVGDLRLYLEGGRNELESFRKMADLYERAKDPMNALLMTETALVYSKGDRDLLARKDKYYFSVDPDRLAAVKAKVETFFDVDYCLRKAKTLLDQKDADADILVWATHLAKLARVMKPDRPGVTFTLARCLLRVGERDAALSLLEDLREATRGSGEDEDAWFQATRTLAELYMNDYARPDLAIHCYLDYRDYSRSGADTYFQLGRCYEATNDPANALKFYEAVTAYDQHPRYWDATEAVRRLKQG